MKLEPSKRKMSGIMITRRHRFGYDRMRRQPIIYQNSKEPEILKTLFEEKTYGLAFNDNGKRYIFSNEDGHEVIFSTNNPQAQARRPMTRKEFEDIREKMAEKAKSSQKETEMLAEIRQLDYAKGHANAVFNVITYVNAANQVRALAININFSRYVYELENEKLIRVDTSRQIATKEITDAKKKDEIVNKMFASKTLQKKINETQQAGKAK